MSAPQAAVPPAPVRSHLVQGSVQERIQAIGEVEQLRRDLDRLQAKVVGLEHRLDSHLAQTWRARWGRLVGWIRMKVNG